MSENKEYTKYCGLGVYIHALTDYGMQIKLMPSGAETPAMRAGLQDGDILAAIHHNGRWLPISDSRIYFQTLGGELGRAMHLQIVRGAPLQREEGNEFSRFATSDPIDVSKLHRFEINVARDFVYPNLPESITAEQRAAIPFKYEEDQLTCIPMAFDWSEVTTIEMAALASPPRIETAKAVNRG